jgi:DNA-directed RNA polymerase specialized sigma24 family protein
VVIVETLPSKSGNKKIGWHRREKSMDNYILIGPSAYDSDPDAEFLIQYDEFIQTAARKAIPQGLFSKDALELEIDDLTQNIRIKLWESCQKRSITNPRAYIKAIAYTKAVDIVRRHKPTISLSVDENGDPCLGNLLISRNEGFQDPAYEVELEEIDPVFLTKTVEAILSLPPRQRQAVLYSIREDKEDCLPLIRALMAQGLDIEVLELPDEESAVCLLKASLSVARKKLQSLREETIAV